jgi:site-specific recombinase XerD
MKKTNSQKELKELITQFLTIHKDRWSARTVKTYEYVLNFLVDWMDRGKSDRHNAKIVHYKFMYWLYEENKIAYQPEELFGKVHRVNFLQVKLPKIASEFLELILTQMKKSTVHNYKVTLKHFYLFLKNEKISLKQIKRKDFELFLKYLLKIKLGTSAREGVIMRVRVYLRWLYEKGSIIHNPDTLIKNSDIPKQPKYLPRPLPVEIDLEIQRRLTASNDIYQLGKQACGQVKQYHSVTNV